MGAAMKCFTMIFSRSLRIAGETVQTNIRNRMVAGDCVGLSDAQIKTPLFCGEAVSTEQAETNH